MKKLVALLLALSMIACLFVGCAGDDGETTTAPTTTAPSESDPPETDPSETDPPETDPSEDETDPTEPANNGVEIVGEITTFNKVALVTDVGTIDDESFNQACWEGVKAFCDANGVDYNYYQPTENTTEARVASVDQAILDGYDVIVMPGYLFGATLIRVQEAYPDVKFIAVDVGSGDMTEDYVTYYEPTANSVCMTFAEEQAGYLAGYATVKAGYTELGFLGGMAVPAVIRYGFGYVQGAGAAAEELGITVNIKYTYGGQFFGDANITAKMEGWYSEGTQVVFACGGGIYTSAVEAANKYEGKVVGVDVDQSYIDPCIITSAMKGLSNVVISTLTDLAKGNWDAEYAGQFLNFNLEKGDYVGIPTDEDSWKLGDFTVEEYLAVKESITSYAVETNETGDPSHLATANITVNFVA